MEHIITDKDKGKRIDIFVTENLDSLSRNYVQKLIKDNNILVNNKSIKPSYILKLQDRVTINLPELKPLTIEPQNLKIDILYEDDDLIAVNKPAGMCTHPGAGRSKDTLVNALLYHCKNLSGIGGICRPGIVHRLDKDTTGVIVVAKNDITHQNLSLQIQKKIAQRFYIALVHGILPSQTGQIELPIARNKINRKKMAVDLNGKPALTYWRVLETKSNISLLLLELKTGRTHQIRVHCSYIKHPVYGDITYGGNKNMPIFFPRQALHAYKFKFIHPRSFKELELIAPLPQDFKELLYKLNINFTL